MLTRNLSGLRAICARHGARNPRIFGSVARGEDRPDSDIDVLVELDSGRTLLDLEMLQIDLSDALGAELDVGTPDLLTEHALRRIQPDLVAI